MADENTLNDLVKSIKEVQALAESKNADTAEVKAQIKTIGDAAAESAAKLQAVELAATAEAKKLQSEIDAVKADYADLYKKSNRMGFGEEDETASQYHKELSRYIRKGVKPSDESLDEIVNQYVHKTLGDSDELALKNAAYMMKDEQGDVSGKGFYMFPETKTARAGSNPDGGYLTAVDRRTDVSVTRIFETSPMRAISQIITTGSGEIELLIDDDENTSGGWVGEETARSNTDNAQLGLLKIAVHEQYANPKATQKLLDDAYVNVEAWLSNKTNDILARTENTAFVSGDGSQKPKGFLSYSAWAVAGTYERNKLEQVNSGTAGAVTADGLKTLQSSLVEAYQPGATFLMKRATFNSVSLLKDGTGAYLINPMLLAQGVGLQLLGKPVYFADDMQAIAADALAVAYGDFGVGYTIVDRIGVRVLRDPYSSKPYIQFYTTKRVGGAVTNYQAIKIQKLAV